jgi:serine/threonine-protein kinase
MTDFIARLKQRKLVQWVIAYVAGAWALLQVLDLIAQEFGWPGVVMRTVTVVLGVGFFAALVLAWYHGERGAQRVGGIELLMLAALLVIAAVAVSWVRDRRSPAPVASVTHAAPASTTIARASHASASAVSSIATIPTHAQPIPAKSIAVLPFENLSADKNNAYFTDGMQDLILTKLAAIGELKVISHTSTEKYASHPDDLKTIAQQLGVATILEGSVQKAGNDVLINVQLIDTRTDRHIWAQSYRRTLSDIFGVEGEVAQKVADALKARLTSAESARMANVPTTNPQAYDAYLLGLHYVDQEDAGDIHAAVPKEVAAFRQAVEADPRFALAWANLALAQSFLMYVNIDTSDATRRQALANARHALALAPDLPQAHFALGYAYRFDFAEYRKALAEFRLAEQGAPNSAVVAAAIAYVEDILGNPDAQLTSLQRAAKLDPRNPNIFNWLGVALAERHRYAAAQNAFQHARALAPADPEIHVSLAQLDVFARGDVAAALAQLAQVPESAQAAPEVVYQRVRLLLLKRDYPAAYRAAQALHQGGRFISPARVLLLQAEASARAGHADEARKLYLRLSALAPASVGNIQDAAVLRYTAQAEAALGHERAALAAVEKTVAWSESRENRLYSSEADTILARIHARFGDAARAVDLLDKQFAHPSALFRADISVPLLGLDPAWDPIRKDSRFQALLKKYANDKSATIPAAPSPADATSGGGNG